MRGEAPEIVVANELVNSVSGSEGLAVMDVRVEVGELP